MLELALFGHQIAGSRSPALHAAFGAQFGIALRYELIDVPDLGPALERWLALGGRGANVTRPFKREAWQRCATRGPEAERAGAVNALVVEADGRLRGECTDGVGLVRDLATNHDLELAGRRVALLGASGAARGVAEALLGAGIASLQVADRDPARSAAFAADFPAAAVGGYPRLAGGGFDLMVNATSASARGELPPLPEGALARRGVAYDLHYADAPTPFLHWARAAGARLALDGWGMLVEQAALSFALWTDQYPDTAPLLRRP